MAPLVLSEATTEVNKLVRYLSFKFFFHFVLVHNNPSQNIWDQYSAISTEQAWTMNVLDQAVS